MFSEEQDLQAGPPSYQALELETTVVSGEMEFKTGSISVGMYQGGKLKASSRMGL